MRPDKITVMIAVAAVIIAVVLAGVQGSLPFGLGAVAAGLAAAALWQIALDRRSNAVRAAERENLEKASALPRPIIEGSVSRYLRPEEEIVPFWPRSELDELVDWIVSERHVAIQLVIGEGGVGKTRIARQLVEELTDRGLGVRCWWVSAGTEEDLAQAAKHNDEPTLLILDYSEMRTSLQETLTRVTNDTDGPVIRVLLLARGAGEW